VTPNARPDSDERGSGLIGTSAGFLVFLLLLFAAVQIMFNLYATTMVTTAAHEAAMKVAGFDASSDRCAAVPAAEAAFVDSLGQYGRAGHATLTWTCNDPQRVIVRITADHPTMLPKAVAGLFGLSHMSKVIEVRTELKR